MVYFIFKYLYINFYFIEVWKRGIENRLEKEINNIKEC